jgi:XRE family transcriptional regulator, regulator of sulfur utilization
MTTRPTACCPQRWPSMIRFEAVDCLGANMITRRDLVVALMAAGITLSAVVRADQQTPLLQSSVFDWNSVPDRPTNAGSVRTLFKGPTATLDELDLHVTTLNPGAAPHPPHKHPNEELLILKEGTVEALVNGEWRRVGPGSVIFLASNQLHGLRNVGTGPAIYHVISWTSPGMKARAQP